MCLPAAEPVVVRVDPSQLAQVLINLAVNARDAMPGVGELIMEVATLDIEESMSSPLLNVAPGNYAILRVQDTGTGMTEEVKSHLADKTLKETVRAEDEPVSQKKDEDVDALADALGKTGI